ncbi:MAG: hypothetical protein SFT92_01175 [Rickettsiales bacterium]|nr:hypothetical protein [Rickettsiales bacterium]
MENTARDEVTPLPNIERLAQHTGADPEVLKHCLASQFCSIINDYPQDAYAADTFGKKAKLASKDNRATYEYARYIAQEVVEDVRDNADLHKKVTNSFSLGDTTQIDEIITDAMINKIASRVSQATTKDFAYYGKKLLKPTIDTTIEREIVAIAAPPSSPSAAVLILNGMHYNDAIRAVPDRVNKRAEFNIDTADVARALNAIKHGTPTEKPAEPRPGIMSRLWKKITDPKPPNKAEVTEKLLTHLLGDRSPSELRDTTADNLLEGMSVRDVVAAYAAAREEFKTQAKSGAAK